MVNQIIVAHLEPGVDRIIPSGHNRSDVYALGFASESGARKLLLVNKLPSTSLVRLDAQLRGGTAWMVDSSYTFEASPRKIESVGASLRLPPFATAVVVKLHS